MTHNLKALVQKWMEENGLVSRIQRLIEFSAPCKCGEPSEFHGYSVLQCSRCAAVMLLHELLARLFQEIARMEIERMESEPRAQEGGAHTPGPWRLDPLNGCISGRDGTQVATTFFIGSTAKQKAEELANAKLIATAPTLLADAHQYHVNGLHESTAQLVKQFAYAMALKLKAAQDKYGHSDGWKSSDWMDECRKKLREHVDKGDPRDVAAYCAFLWHHGEKTT